MDEQTLPQYQMIMRLRQLCRDDPRVRAGMLYGSFAEGRGDRFSDIDCILYFEDEVLPDLDPRQWAEQLAPLLAFYRNEFDNWAALYENLVRVEYHFDPASQILALQRFRGVLSFPLIEHAILLDRTGELAECLGHLSSPPDLHESMNDVLYLQDSLCNWLIFGTNVLARGEVVRAGEILRLVQDNLLRLSRMDEARTQQWITPSRNFEIELSVEAQNNFRSCTSGGLRAELYQAYWNSWLWGQTLLRRLAGRLGEALNEALLRRVGQHLEEFIPPEAQAGIPLTTGGVD